MSWLESLIWRCSGCGRLTSCRGSVAQCNVCGFTLFRLPEDVRVSGETETE